MLLQFLLLLLLLSSSSLLLLLFWPELYMNEDKRNVLKFHCSIKDN